MLPKTYQLVVRHDFGANATVTVDYIGWKFDSSQEVEYGPTVTPINAAVVADATDEATANIDNSVNKHFGIHGNISVQGTSLTGVCNLYLRTVSGLSSDSVRSRLLRTVRFEGANGPYIASYDSER